MVGVNIWRQGFRHPTRNQYIGWFAQIESPPPYQPLLEQTVTLHAYNPHQLFKKIQIIYVVEPNCTIGLVPSFRKGSLPTNFYITNFFFFSTSKYSFSTIFVSSQCTYRDRKVTVRKYWSYIAFSGAPVLYFVVV